MDEEEDPFAEQPLVPVLRTEERILQSLREQLQGGLLSLLDYERAAKGAVKVLTASEADEIHRPGTTLRKVFTNERRQLQAGLITPDEFQRLKKAAVGALKMPSAGDLQQQAPRASPRDKTASPKASPREKKLKASPRRFQISSSVKSRAGAMSTRPAVA